jgi:membrane protein DedA with SNARE-associated domain
VALVVFVSAVGIPTGVPVYVVLVLAGAYLVGSWPVLLIAILAMGLAELAGTLVVHLVARTGGVQLLDRLADKHQAQVHETFGRWKRRMGDRDIPAIAVLRLVPFVRMGVTIATGLMEIPVRDFAIGAGIAAVIWATVPLTLGYVFRGQLDSVVAGYDQVAGAVPVIVAVAVLIILTLVLAKSAGARAKARSIASAPKRWFSSRDSSRLKVTQESPPGLH